jgi:hypothetical protein
MEQKREVDRHKLKIREQAEQSGHALASEGLSTQQDLHHDRLMAEQDLENQKKKAEQAPSGEK